MIKLAIKDLKLFFADKRSMLLAFAVPIALITLFAFAFGGVGQSKGTAQATTVLIGDGDKSSSSASVIAKLDSLKEFDVWVTTIDSAERLVKKGDEAAALIFHKGFGDSMQAGNKPPMSFEYDAAKEAEVGILQGALIGQLMRLVGSQSMAKNALTQFDANYPDMDATSRARIHAQIQENFSSSKQDDAQSSLIKSTPIIAEEVNSPGLIHAVAGTSIMMLLFAVVGMGASLLDEKQEGTLKKLLYSPLNTHQILFGKMISSNIISCLTLVVMFVYARLAFGLDITSHMLSLSLAILFTAYACSSFGMLIASFAKSRQQVQGMSTLIVLVMSCLGGSMIPSFAMPLFMRQLSVFTVNYWGIQSFYDIFWRRLSLTDPTFLTRLLVLFLIGTVLNLLAVYLFKRNALKIA